MVETSRTPAPAASRIIDHQSSITLANGRTVSGRLEHFAAAKSLAIFPDEALEPVVLTVLVAEAPEAHAALANDQVLIRNWTELRGAAESLAAQGLVDLTGETVAVGTFRLQGLVARIV